MSRAKAVQNFCVSMLMMAAGGLSIWGPAASTQAQTVQHLNITQPGGMPGQPIITSITQSNRQVTVKWRAFSHPSMPFQLQGNTALRPGQWQVLADTWENSATVPMGSSATFRIVGGAPMYAGAQACGGCHVDMHASWKNTAHAGALETLKKIGQDKNAYCLACHTVGFGLPTGYTNETMKAYLGGVQCESCHGPAALHMANPMDPAAKPIKELASQVCGGCHTGDHVPAYDEWKTTGHARVTEDMNPAGRISSCGRCHSGSARLALIDGKDPAVAVTNDANMAIECGVCHDPHKNTANGHQLRNPTASTANYFLSTSDVFTNKYNANINICGQCHNHRGASYTSNSRPPHHSPQYNMLIGTVGELSTGGAPNQPAAHALMITNQCVGCHMQSEEYKAGPPVSIAKQGHKFEVESYDSCKECHPLPEALTDFVQLSVSNQIYRVKSWLDYWAVTKAPAALQSKYKTRAWEYTNPGTLSNPAGVTGAGPSSSEQSQIPVNIQKARFNLYIVYHDGSFGVHNGPFSVRLLEEAEKWIQQELAK